MEQLSRNVVRTTDVIGKKILDYNQDDLGKIEELVLDKFSGQVRYAVLAYGGFMGLGSEFYAIPWGAFEYRPTNDAFKVSFSQEDIKKAPGFNKDSWPDFADANWDRSTNEFYNHFIQPKSPMCEEQKEFISEGGNSQPLQHKNKP
jgi:hypothetical protein